MTLEELAKETLTRKHRRLMQEKCRHGWIYTSTVSGPNGTFSNSFCYNCWKSWHTDDGQET